MTILPLAPAGPDLEGKEIAVWVHSNLEGVDLFHNGRSLGAKDVPKDSHVAWNVAYVPGSIEARGFKDGRLVLTARRDTTGPAAKLALRADRQEIAADGEDVAIFAVEVQDAVGRIVLVPDNKINFRVTGAGKLIGTGNGDPTNHEPDGGTTRKVFSGLCLAIVQSSQSDGSVTVEVTSPGLAAATTIIRSKPVNLRPQVAVWERAVPTGPGVTGLWRPNFSAALGTGGDPMALGGAGGDMVFTLRQEGAAITGMVEGPGGGFAGEITGPIQDGKIDDAHVSFRARSFTYSGSVNGELIEFAEKRPASPPRRRGVHYSRARRSSAGDWPGAGRHGSVFRRRPVRARSGDPQIARLGNEDGALRGIAAALNRQGRRTRSGSQWRLESVARVTRRDLEAGRKFAHTRADIFRSAPVA